jgi:hypothetical protein
MKIICAIPKNEEGYVLAEFPKAAYKFEENEDGELMAEVDNEDHVAHLVGTGNFYPHDASDYQSVMDGIIGGEGNEEMDEFEGDDEQSDPNALPIEALTPASKPKPRKPRTTTLE